MFIRPWDEKSKQILERLARDTRVYIKEPEISRKFGRFFPELFDKNTGFADIGRISKRNESVFVLRPNTGIMPIKGKKFKFFRL